MDAQTLPAFVLQRLNKLRSKAAHAQSDAKLLRDEYNAAMFHVGEVEQSLKKTVNRLSNEEKRALLQSNIAEAKAKLFIGEWGF